MSNLSKYIEEIKKYVEENNFTELEKIRYVYLDLGKRFTFSQEFFAGNSKSRRNIYDRRRSERLLEEDFSSNTAICKSLSYIVEKILLELGVDVRTEVDSYDTRHCAHIYNVITPSDGGSSYIIDLQEDLENIQSHSYTKNFGVSLENRKIPVLRRFDIEQIDRKFGYIRDDFYYADDYLYLLKSDIDLFDGDLEGKAEFVFENIDIYENPNIKYPERYWHHQKLIQELFTEKERRKIRQLDCYRIVDGREVYQNGICVERKGGVDIYLYSTKENRYIRNSLEEFAELTENGLICKEKIPGLNQILEKRKNANEEPDER